MESFGAKYISSETTNVDELAEQVGGIGALVEPARRALYLYVAIVTAVGAATFVRRDVAG